MDLDTYRVEVKKLVRDDANALTDPDDYDFTVRKAVKRYARVKPREVVADVPGDGGHDYALPQEFEPKSSRVLQVELPAGEVPPAVVDEALWTLYHQPTGWVLRFLETAPDTDDTIRITFTAAHSVDAQGSTIPAVDADVILYLAAAIGCEQLAAAYSDEQDSTIVADAIDHTSKAAEFAKRAKRYQAMAEDTLGRPLRKAKAASGTTHWGARFQNLLTHRER